MRSRPLGVLTPEASIEKMLPPAPALAELDRLGDEIAELAAHLEAATARLLDLIREFDARGGWNNGFRSCAEWLSWRVGLGRLAAREHVRAARALGELPRLRQALARGELSYSKVRELTRVATPETEERLLAVGRAGTAEHVERIVRGWRRVDRKAELQEANLQHARRGLSVYPVEDGTVRVRGNVTPEVGALLLKALAAAREVLYQRRRAQQADADTHTPDIDQPTMEQQQADSLALLAETALHHGIDPGTPGERYQVVVHVDAAALAEDTATLADADEPGGPGQVGARRWRQSSTWNFSATGLRRQPGGHAPRRRRATAGGGRADADHPTGVAAGAAEPGSRLPLSGL